jgi:hypothetical protein
MQQLVREAISQGYGAVDPAALAAQVRLFRSAVLTGASHAVINRVSPEPVPVTPAKLALFRAGRSAFTVPAGCRRRPLITSPDANNHKAARGKTDG